MMFNKTQTYECNYPTYEIPGRYTTKEKSQVAEEPEDDDIPLYEVEWASSTSAHGFSRIVAPRSTIPQRIIWTCAILACIIYVAIQLSRSVEKFNQHDTTTEFTNRNAKFLYYPSITICNFNRWRSSKLTEEDRKKLTSILSVYSYDYVIPELSDDAASVDASSSGGSGPNLDLLNNIREAIKIPDTTTPPTTTTPPPITCALPKKPAGMDYKFVGEPDYYIRDNITRVHLGTQIVYNCTQQDYRAEDGDINVCRQDTDTVGVFRGRLPLCVSYESVGVRLAVSNPTRNRDAAAVTAPISESPQYSPEVMICFWIRLKFGDIVDGTNNVIFSYGVNQNETIFSVMVGNYSNYYFSVKYQLFDQVGKTLTYTRYENWNPYCVFYSVKQGLSLIYKYRSFSTGSNPYSFEATGTDAVKHQKLFPTFGQVTYFNDYVQAMKITQGKTREPYIPSTGGEVTNLNMWERNVSSAVMNNMLWEGNIFSMNDIEIASTSGNLKTTNYTFNVSELFDSGIVENALEETAGDEGKRRKKRQAINTTTLKTETTRNPVDGSTTTNRLNGVTTTDFLSENSTTSLNNTISNTLETPVLTGLNGTYVNTTNWPQVTGSTNVTLNDTDFDFEAPEEEEFNYAKFTLRAGWQLVDSQSGHEEEEPHTLLHCKFRGKTCDSRWFEHRFGAYGNCYTFNQNLTIDSFRPGEDINPPIFQDNAGPEGGLSLLLDIQTWEYSESTQLSGNSELGLKFIIHADYDVPVINSQGYAVGPGKKAFVGFSKRTYTNIEGPWGECVPSRKLNYFQNYTLNGCSMECKLDRVVSICKCRPYYFPGNATICDVTQLAECAFIEIAKVNADFSGLCNCPIACNIEEYNVKLSYSSFPNQPYGEDLGNQLNITMPESTGGRSLYPNKQTYIRSNVVNMDLYFESMSESFVKQQKAMDENALLGDIGGQLGLFIGCSMLTGFEFIECIFMSLYYHCKRNRNKRLKQQAKLIAKHHTIEMPENNSSRRAENGNENIYTTEVNNHNGDPLHYS